MSKAVCDADQQMGSSADLTVQLATSDESRHCWSGHDSILSHQHLHNRTLERFNAVCVASLARAGSAVVHEVMPVKLTFLTPAAAAILIMI